MKKKQPTAFEVALAAKRGDKIDGVVVDPKTLRGAAKQLYNEMTEQQLVDYAKRPVFKSRAAERLIPVHRRIRRI